MNCCTNPENMTGYAAVNRHGWAAACKRCGRAWAAPKPTGGDRDK